MDIIKGESDQNCWLHQKSCWNKKVVWYNEDDDDEQDKITIV